MKKLYIAPEVNAMGLMEENSLLVGTIKSQRNVGGDPVQREGFISNVYEALDGKDGMQDKKGQGNDGAGNRGKAFDEVWEDED